MVLASAYARATDQAKHIGLYVLMGWALGNLGCAQRILQQSGYIELNASGIYEATEKGINFMQDRYAKQELWGVKIR